MTNIKQELHDLRRRLGGLNLNTVASAAGVGRATVRKLKNNVRTGDLTMSDLVKIDGAIKGLQHD